MKKKAFLIIPTLHQGGAERVISQLANYFTEQGVEVHLILFAQSLDFYKVNSSVIVHRLNYKNSNPIRNVYNQLKSLYAIRQLKLRYKPDASLSFLAKSNILNIISSFNLDTKTFISERGNPTLKYSFPIETLRLITYPHATGIIAQTDLAKRILFQRTGNKNINTIHNPIKEIVIDKNINKEKIILNIGRLVPEKGQSHLLKAFSKLDDKSWKLAILGEGPLRDEITRQVESLGLSSQVMMPGAVENIDEWLAKSSLFVLSSLSEGFPNALAEAMIAGLPCISFDCDTGPRDLIQDKVNGLLVNVADHDKLAESINYLVENYDYAQTIGLEAAKVKKRLSLDSTAKKYLDFIFAD